ncbi:myristylated tegument protein [Proboscivirus elephantidbeta4]|uniref:Myristylated tegument protein n=1 Tax=Elephant endotheliotropic herpesvirus 4 TaxID=548914 RepID=A0A0S1TKS8_9BETA|nr:myristylated tegument protein [Elephant endotheliotropic herpesvirus 4]ALM26019.1 myristylated tegument protein [Elephant endotheliotropic herpesvirus 4]
MGSELSKGLCGQPSGSGKNAVGGGRSGCGTRGRPCCCCCRRSGPGLKDKDGQPILLDEAFEELSEDDVNAPLVTEECVITTEVITGTVTQQPPKRNDSSNGYL